MKTKALTVAALALLTIGGAANALSCMRPDAARLYAQARDSDEVFAIVTGRLHPERPISVPQVAEDGAFPKDQNAVTRVRMTGLVLGVEDFDQAFDREIDVRVTCMSIWCGDPKTDRDIIAALRLGGEVPELEIGPCGGMAMVASEDQILRLLECHRFGNCTIQ